MSNELAKFMNSRRRHKTDVKVARQVKIAKAHGLGFHDQVIKQPHRMAKHHVMDCGNPGCYLCGNPRKTDSLLRKNVCSRMLKRLLTDIQMV